MNFEVHKNVDKTEYFLGSLITCKWLKQGDNISNKFYQQYYLIFFVNYVRNSTDRNCRGLEINIKILYVFICLCWVN